MSSALLAPHGAQVALQTHAHLRVQTWIVTPSSGVTHCIHSMEIADYVEILNPTQPIHEAIELLFESEFHFSRCQTHLLSREQHRHESRRYLIVQILANGHVLFQLLRYSDNDNALDKA